MLHHIITNIIFTFIIIVSDYKKFCITKNHVLLQGTVERENPYENRSRLLVAFLVIVNNNFKKRKRDFPVLLLFNRDRSATTKVRPFSRAWVGAATFPLIKSSYQARGAESIQTESLITSRLVWILKESCDLWWTRGAGGNFSFRVIRNCSQRSTSTADLSPAFRYNRDWNHRPGWFAGCL